MACTRTRSRVLGPIFKWDLLSFSLGSLRLLRNQRAQTNDSKILDQSPLHLIQPKVICIKLRLCVGQKVGPRKCVRARGRRDPWQRGDPLQLAVGTKQKHAPPPGSVKTRANGEKCAGTHIVPHNAMFRILRRDPLQASCLGRGHAAHFRAHRESIDSTNERIEIVLIIEAIPSTVQGNVARLEALQLGIYCGELLAEEECLLLL